MAKKILPPNSAIDIYDDLEELSIVNNSIAKALIKGMSVKEIQQLEGLAGKTSEEIESEIVQVASKMRSIQEKRYLSVKEISGFFQKIIMESELRRRELWELYDTAKNTANLSDTNTFKYSTLLSILHDMRNESIFLRTMAVELGVIPKAASVNKLDVNVTTIDQSIRRLEIVERKIDEKQDSQLRELEGYNLVRRDRTQVVITQDDGIFDREEAEIIQIEENI